MADSLPSAELQDLERERFLPHGIVSLQQQLAERPFADPDDPERFAAFCRLVGALVHYRFHEREQSVVAAWHAIGDEVEPESQDAGATVSAELQALLEHANYSEVTIDDIHQAMEEESLIPLKLSVDLDVYDELLIRRRGGHHENVELKSFFGLRKSKKTITVDDRTVIFTRIRPASWFVAQGIDPEERNLQPGSASLKMFQNVPRADVEMLLPSTEVKFRTIDTLTMAIPAVASGVAVVATKLLPTIGLIALTVGFALGVIDERPNLDQSALLILLGGVMTLGGFLFKQYSNLKNRRVNYLKTLSENLYFRTLGDGPGVLHTLLSTAEEQEVAEILLGYRFLLDEPGGLSLDKLDRHIEDWYAESGLNIDFDVPDSAAKLEELGLVVKHPGEVLEAVPLVASLRLLDEIWDGLFNYAEVRNEARTIESADETGLGTWLRRVTSRFNR